MRCPYCGDRRTEVLRRFIEATTRIVTGDASTAGPGSVPKRGLFGGAALSGSGREIVGPGIDENHPLKTANCVARPVRTGSLFCGK